MKNYVQNECKEWMKTFGMLALGITALTATKMASTAIGDAMGWNGKNLFLGAVVTCLSLAMATIAIRYDDNNECLKRLKDEGYQPSWRQ